VNRVVEVYDTRTASVTAADLVYDIDMVRWIAAAAGHVLASCR